ncbi:exocyst complex component exo70 [Ascosphaera acerosa]|nr:exocyst complex component exo70 [Ascosphaera acerosa]
MSATTTSLRSRIDDPQNPAVRIYGEVRGAYLSNSLSNLATASINTAKRRPSDGPYKHGTNGIGVYASGVGAMVVAEDANVSAIFPVSQRARALEAACAPCLDDLHKTLRELNAHVKAHVMTDCFLAFEVLDIVSGLAADLGRRVGGGGGAQLRSRLTELLRPTRETCRSCLSEILAQTRQKAATTLALPSDGQTVPFVGELMATLVALTQYSEPLAEILRSIGDGKWKGGSSGGGGGGGGGGNGGGGGSGTDGTATPSPREAKAPQLPIFNTVVWGSSNDGSSDSGSSKESEDKKSTALLANYIADVLDVLLSTLEARARTVHRSKLLLGIFLSNTVCVADRAVNGSSELAALVHAPGSAVASRLESHRKKALSVYLAAWREPSAFLLDVQHTSRASITAASGVSAAASGLLLK